MSDTVQPQASDDNVDPRLPLIDLHRHLDGSVRLETILELGRKYNLPLPASDLEGLRPHVQIVDQAPSVMAFISKFYWLTAILKDYDACRRVAYENVEDLHAEGIDYAELRFSPWFMAEPNQLNPQGVVEAVIDGVQAGSRDFHLPVKLIGILSRTYGPEIAWKELAALETGRYSIIALDLGGDEANFPGSLFTAHFKRARDLGWKATVHAGESAGPESIWQAVRELGASRIGHAVAALKDPALIDYMREFQIGIESNLTSNVQTSTVQDYSAHPLKAFLEAGLLATINTDDPAISGITLRHEYRLAAPAAGLSREQIHLAQANALKIAFITDEERQRLAESKRTQPVN
jgi:adenosine deaminase